MSETGVRSAELDRLGERVQKAADVLHGLRLERDQLRGERDVLARQLQSVQKLLRGREPRGVLAELEQLRRERKEVATRIEALVKKLARLES